MDYLEFLRTSLMAFMIFAPLELLLPRRKGQGLFRPLWKTDTVYLLVNVVLISFGGALFITGGLMILVPLVPEGLQTALAGLPLWLQFVLVFIVADLWYYAMHRAEHQLPLLWRFHAIHHSIEDMDWLAAHRIHAVDQILTGASTLLLPMALGFSDEAVLLYSFQFGWHSLLKHSNIRVSWGPLRWILATPVFHHWHHANQPEAYDRNFAGQLPLIDVLFGTAIMKEREAPEVYGVDEHIPAGYVDQFFHPFRRREAGENTSSASASEQAALQPTRSTLM
ncbi:sterol desaturase family protein [Hyphomonas sp.]|uniref:sterol desaturase family protein n=1 Tax=Hyphomonas sp. TaxID=87 RepID=UPI00352977F3